MKTKIIITTIILLLAFAPAALAATIVYQPDKISITAIPGETTDLDFNIAFDAAGRHSLYVTSLDVIGDIPAHWVNLKIPVMVINDRQVRVATEIAVSEFASPGTYQASIIVQGDSRRTPVDTGKGITVTMEVKNPCQDVPAFKDIQIGPEAIKAQKGKTVEIRIAGTIAVAKGCNLSKAEYELNDEYGKMDAKGNLTIDAAGNFGITLPVEASRMGQDKDGRTYTVKLSATDEAGQGRSGDLVITVEHDQGKDKNR